MAQITRRFERPNPTRMRLLLLLAIVGIASRSHAAEPPADRDVSGPAFQVSYSEGLSRAPVSGRVYVFLGPGRSSAEPRLGPNWFRPQPFFAIDAVGWRPGEPLRIDSKAAGFPDRLDRIPPGKYAAQAVLRLNRDTHRIGDGEGNAYGPVEHVQIDPERQDPIALNVDRFVEPRHFPSSDRIKLVEVRSPKLSAFYGREIKQRAAVILPKDLVGAERPEKRPTLYMIPGFGGDRFMAPRFADDRRLGMGGDFIRVLLDPDCGTGHHVFADSATNGPRGAALVKEFISYIEKTFPVVADPRARLLTGHSSGGWSSLWLQVTYPDVFGGTWSTSPDPVDFRDFQRIDLYAAGESMFRDRQGQRRPIARMGKFPVLWYDSFSRMDDVIGWGGQLSSFEAVFSPLDRDGRPRKIWDRSTGAIDHDVARTWEAYDIRLVLERNWPKLGPKLKGKLRVITGSLDTFYLEGPVQLLKDSLARLGSDAVVEIIPDRDHSTVLDPALAARLDREMRAKVVEWLPARRASQSEKVPRR
jgi:pimeloyl-ACP methyl ester carboxylesterase